MATRAVAVSDGQELDRHLGPVRALDHGDALQPIRRRRRLPERAAFVMRASGFVELTGAEADTLGSTDPKRAPQAADLGKQGCRSEHTASSSPGLRPVRNEEATRVPGTPIDARAA